jgi:predicted nucleic-acid-binding protein
MIGLDTNILVRYFTQDDLLQSPLATEIIERRLTNQQPGFVSVVAMAETVWVLDRAYRLGRAAIANVVEVLLEAEAVIVECEHEVFAAMVILREGRGQFSDALIGALNTRAGCSRTITFDRGALGLPGFEHP